MEVHIYGVYRVYIVYKAKSQAAGNIRVNNGNPKGPKPKES